MDWNSGFPCCEPSTIRQREKHGPSGGCLERVLRRKGRASLTATSLLVGLRRCTGATEPSEAKDPDLHEAISTSGSAERGSESASSRLMGLPFFPPMPSPMSSASNH